MLFRSDSADVVMVGINPSFRPGVPRTNAEIADRLNELTFSGALMAEMRAIAFVQSLIEEGAVSGAFGARLKKILIHSINDEPAMEPLGAVSKFNVEPDFLDYLFKLGRKAALTWLASTFDSLGLRRSIDIRARFL